MAVQVQDRKARLPWADRDFFEIFLPYEIMLAQRRAALWTSIPEDELPRLFWGLFLVRLEPLKYALPPHPPPDPKRLAETVDELLRWALRESDIVGRFDDGEHLAVVRDLEYQQARVVAERFLAAAASSKLISGAGMQTRLGYLIYPLSNQSNLAPEQWSTLLALARRLSAWGDAAGGAIGFGLSRGPQTASTGMPETDLVALFEHDAGSLIDSGILHLERVEQLG